MVIRFFCRANKAILVKWFLVKKTGLGKKWSLEEVGGTKDNVIINHAFFPKKYGYFTRKNQWRKVNPWNLCPTFYIRQNIRDNGDKSLFKAQKCFKSFIFQNINCTFRFAFHNKYSSVAVVFTEEAKLDISIPWLVSSKDFWGSNFFHFSL